MNSPEILHRLQELNFHIALHARHAAPGNHPADYIPTVHIGKNDAQAGLQIVRASQDCAVFEDNDGL